MKRKSFLTRISNFKVVGRYIRESANIVRQGHGLKDKFLLSLYFSRIPWIVIKSLFTNKSFRELEEKRKYLWGNITLKNKKGVFFCGNNILTVHTVNENHENKLYPYLDLQAGVFVDVGAHVGKYSIWLGKKPNNKVIALEPEKNNFYMLQKNISLNHLSNVIAINKGAYSAPGTIPFYLADRGDGTHSVLRINDQSKETFMPVDTLDNIAESLKLSGHISMIKIDAEGAELEVLKGAKRVLEMSHPLLIIEIWQQNKENLEKVFSLLELNKYSSKQLDDDNYYFS